MPRVKVFQTNFTSGELDDFLLARVDTAAYFNGARRMRNVFILPQGGTFRRFGLLFNDQLPNETTQEDLTAGGIVVTAPEGGVAANAVDDNRLSHTQAGAVGVTDPYVLIKVDLTAAFTIQFADIISLTYDVAATTPTPNEWRIQFSTDDITFFDFGLVVGRSPTDTATLTDGITHRSRSATFGGTSARFWRVVKIGGTDPGGAAGANISEFRLHTMGTVLSNCRIIPFQFSVTQRYKLVVTDGNIAVYKFGVFQVDIPLFNAGFSAAPKFDTAKLPFLNWTQSLDTAFLFHPDVQSIQIQRQGSDTDWQPSLVTYTNIPQFDFGSGLEDMVSSNRGWFVSGVFFQGRQCFAGSRSRPQTFVASKSGLIFNLDVGTALDDEAIVFTAGTDEVSEFFQINAGRHLQMFASGGEFYVPISDTETMTPNNFTLRRTTRRGSKGNIVEDNSRPRVIEVDGAVLFIQRGGKSLREFLFTDTEAAYRAENLTLLSTDLVVDPLTVALRKSTSTQEADYILMPNNDGTLAVFVTLRAQNVNGMTLQSTRGFFKDAGVDLDDMYFCIKRTINGVDVLYLEKFTVDVHMDAAISRAPLGGVEISPNTLFNVTIAPFVDQSTGGSSVVHTSAGGGAMLLTKVGAADLCRSEATQVLTAAVQHTLKVDLIFDAPGDDDVTIEIGTATGLSDIGSFPLVSIGANQTFLFTPTVGQLGTVFIGVEKLGPGITGSARIDNLSLIADPILQGLGHLEGETVEIIIDTLVHAPRVVSGGQVSLIKGGTLAEAGLAFPDGTPLIRLMPVEGNLQEGTIIGKKKRIVDATFKLKDTKHFVVKATGGLDNVVLFRTFGSGLLDQPLPAFTGEKKVEGLLGYTDEGSLDITQDVPVDMTILGIAQRVAV